MDQLVQTILKSTYTLNQFKKRLKLIQSHFQQQFFQGPQFEAETADLEWFKTLPKEFLGSFNKDNLSKMMADLSSKVSSMQVMTVFLPFEATEEALEQIGQKVRTVYGPSFLIDIKYNPSLIAGCALSYKGIYKDYSLHSKILERKLAVIQSFKKFLH